MLKRSLLLMSGIALVGMALSCSDENTSSLKQGWDNANNPNKLANVVDGNGHLVASSMTYNYQNIPEQGRTHTEPWSADYWPSYKNGLAHRYQSNQHKYAPLNRSQVLSLSQAQINSLSPAEKYDIIKGDYDFSLTKREQKKSLSNPPTWEGICHGWAAASIIEPTPGKGVWASNSDGVQVYFYQDDLKGLMSYAYAESELASGFMGKRCEQKDLTTSDLVNSNSDFYNHPCWDTNPGALHIVLGNAVGRSQNSIVIDRYVGQEVWNQPVASYSFRYGTVTPLNRTRLRPEHRARGTVNTLDVALNLVYVVETSSSTQPSGNAKQMLTMQYSLDLDAQGNILGGEWYPGQSGPDFVWFGPQAPRDTYVIAYSTIRELFNRSLNGGTTPVIPTPVVPNPNPPTPPTPINTCHPADPFCNGSL